MLCSVVYLLVRRLLGCLMVLARGEVSKDAELLVLRHQNAVLRRQISRVRSQPGDRLWLSALSRLIPRRRWGEVFAVTPATLLAWHRRLAARKWDYTSRRHPGRPSTAAAIRELVIRMATDNPTWGTGGCRASSPSLAARSQPPRCGRSCMTLGSIPRRAGRAPDLEAVPDRAGPGHSGGRLCPRGHRAASAPLRPDGHRARHSPRSPGGLTREYHIAA